MSLIAPFIMDANLNNQVGELCILQMEDHLAPIPAIHSHVIRKIYFLNNLKKWKGVAASPGRYKAKLKMLGISQCQKVRRRSTSKGRKPSDGKCCRGAGALQGLGLALWASGEGT